MPGRLRGFARTLGLIAAAGACLRALYLFTIARETVGIGDWWFYHWQANLIAEGRGFLDPFQLLEDHARPSAGHPPLYPLVLSGLSKLGLDGTLDHRSLGLVLGAVTIVLVGLLGRRIGGERAGLVAAAVAAIYPIFIGVDGALMAETLYGPLIAGMLLVALRLVERPSVADAAGLGALIALAALTRSEALLFIPLLAIPLAWRGGAGRGVRLAAALGACVLVLGPWAIRNASTFDRFVPISTNDATVLAGANCGLTYHGVDTGGWNIQCISTRSEADESLQAAKWRDEGLDYMGDHLGRLPAVAVIRFLRVWDLWQPRRQVQFAEGRHKRAEQAGIAMYFLLLPLAAVALWRLRRRAGWQAWILASPFLAVAITSVTGYGIPRLRHAAEIPLVVLAALTATALLERRSRDREAVAA